MIHFWLGITNCYIWTTGFKSFKEYICKKNGYKPTVSASDEKTIQEYSAKYCNDKDYANGRDVRNYFEKIIRNQANRIASLMNAGNPISNNELTEINCDDVKNVEIRRELEDG